MSVRKPVVAEWCFYPHSAVCSCSLTQLDQILLMLFLKDLLSAGFRVSVFQSLFVTFVRVIEAGSRRLSNLA